MSTRTNQAGGYVANVGQANNNAEIFRKMQQDHTEALANLATAARSDREAVTLLSKKISELTSQVTTLTKYLTNANKTITSLKRNGNRGGGGGGGGGDGGGGNNNNNDNNNVDTGDRNVWSRTGRKFNTNGYCFSY